MKIGYVVMLVATLILAMSCTAPTSIPTPPPPPTSTPDPAPTPTPIPTPTPPPASTSSPQSRDFYSGPLFDTHLHLNPDMTLSFGSADALLRYLDKNQVLWAIGFYNLPPGEHPMVSRATTIIRGSRSRVVPLLQPWSPGAPISGAFRQGQYTEAVLRGYLQPQGIFQGVGEFPFYETDLQTVSFESLQMQTVFQLVNEMKGIVMIHPSGDPRGRRMDLAEMSPSIRKYPNITFLFHGGTFSFDLALRLMSEYPNVYFTLDATHILLGPWGHLMYSEGKGSGSAQRFVEDVNQVGVERILEESLKQALSRFAQCKGRILWGTDRAMPWHFDDSATELMITISRRFIARLPTELQENYAFRNALKVFGLSLTPNP